MTGSMESNLEAARKQARIDDLEEALWRIVQWSEAYPLDIFPEPDWVKARKALAEHGITMDSVASSCMRHVVEGVGKIAREALNSPSPTQDQK